MDHLDETAIDCAIIGGGPAGLAVAIELQRLGLSYVVYEKRHIGYNVSRFPIAMTFFSSRELLEIDDFAMTITEEKPTREQYMVYLIRLAKSRRLNVCDYTTVGAVEQTASGFQLQLTSTLTGQTRAVSAKTVVAAFGALDHPNMLGVPGEDLPHVSHYFPEVYPFINHSVLIVGAGNSALETSLLLHRAGAKVSLSFREAAIDAKRAKYWLYPDISKRLEKGEIAGYPSSRLLAIEPNRAILETPKGRVTVAADFVLLLTGYLPDLDYLKSMNIDIDPQSSIPAHNPDTLETNIPGLFIAGSITGGNVAGKIFIENSRFHGEAIAPRIHEIIQNQNLNPVKKRN